MLRIVIPAMLLIFQIGAIGYARAVPTRYFCWAPFDIQTLYHATAVVNDKQLNAREFMARYRRQMRGTDNRSPQHVIDMIEQAEMLHPGDKTTIVFNYRINGGAIQQWTWPIKVTEKASIVDPVLENNGSGARPGGARRGGRAGQADDSGGNNSDDQ